MYTKTTSNICPHVTHFADATSSLRTKYCETALIIVFNTWLLPVPQYFMFVYIQPKK